MAVVLSVAVPMPDADNPALAKTGLTVTALVTLDGATWDTATIAVTESEEAGYYTLQQDETEVTTTGPTQYKLSAMGAYDRLVTITPAQSEDYLSAFATKAEVLALSPVQEAPSLDDFATKAEVLALSPVQAAPNISDLATKADLAGLAPEGNATANKDAILAAIPGASTPDGYVRINQDTLGTDSNALGSLLPGSQVTPYLSTDTDYSPAITDFATADVNGDWYLDVPEDALYVLVARLPGYPNVTVEVQT
jgi:hypothetical protein